MKKSIFIFFILFFNYLSISFAKDNFIEKPINSINNLTENIAKVPFKLLKETAKKVTTVGTKPLLFGMAAVTMLSSGIEDNNQNIEELKNELIIS